jgi:FkbH-like protein
MSKKIAILSDITFDLIIKELKKNQDLDICFYQFDSIIPTLFSRNESLVSSDIVLIHSDAYFHQYDAEAIDELYDAVHHFALTFKGKIVFSNAISAFPSTNLKYSFSGISDLFFTEKREFLFQLDNVFVFDFQNIIARIGIQQSYHFKLGHLYQMPYTKFVLTQIIVELPKLFDFLTTQEKKVIILDCDNTLWGGVIGEDGLEGVQINKNQKGILYLHFQQFIRQKMKEGFLLAICSKNNENDVKEAFEKLNMPLQWTDFVAVRINWEAKVENLKSIATQLNVGLESFIFIDDSDFEIQSIRTLLPEVCALQINTSYDDFIQLKEHFAFKRKRILSEDLKKTEDYKVEAQRQQFQTQVSDFQEYIKSLQIKMEFFINEKSHFVRYAQMTEKTNQFNFNKEVFSVNDLESYTENRNLVYGLSVSDRFGDYGLIGLILVDVQQNEADIRNYLMSCRALGRRIEFDFWDYITNDIKDRKLNLNKVCFKKTEKNKPAQDFLEQINRQV